MERVARLEEIKIPLPEPLGGHEELSAVLGIPEWWPTGSRVAMVLAHGQKSNVEDPLIRELQSRLTDQKFLTLRFNFPFAEGKRRRAVDPLPVLQRAFRAAIAVLGRDPSATPAHLFLGGVGLGAHVASTLAAELLPIEGLCLLGYPLHPEGKPEEFNADPLFRIVSPMLFVQGAQDPTCDPRVLQKCMSKVGAPTTLRVSEGLGRHLVPLDDTPKLREAVANEVFETIMAWLSNILKED